MTTLTLGIDIGGTKIAAALVSPDGQETAFQRMPTPVAAGADAILAATIALGTQVLAAASAEDEVVAVGVGSAGHVDHARGVIVYAADTLPGWGGTHLGRELEQALDLPVVVDNDVNALALGEQRFGAGQSFQHALYVTVGTGVGGALIHAGNLWRGASWSAGELGHLVIDWDGGRRCSCGRTGHLEAYTSGPAMAERYRQLAGASPPIDLRAVAERAQAGDLHAQQAIAEGARVLGMGLGGLLNVLDMQALVIGGGVAELGDLWWQPLEQALRANPLPGPARIALRRARLGKHAVLVGAAWMALTSSAALAARIRSS